MILKAEEAGAITKAAVEEYLEKNLQLTFDLYLHDVRTAAVAGKFSVLTPKVIGDRDIVCQLLATACKTVSTISTSPGRRQLPHG